MRSAGWAVTGLLLLAAAPSAFSADSYLLYKPEATETTVAPASPEEGILVTGVTIQEGDTLKRLARKYRGRSSYFPQILLFNKIGNADRIRAGARLLIPVAPEHASTQPSKQRKKKTAVSHRRKSVQAASVVPAKLKPILPAEEPSLAQYHLAVAAYKKRQLRQALQEFDRFLADFPNSPLAADASLYRADCLLSLSQQ